MTDAALRALADEAGVAAAWQDVHGAHHDVGADTLRAVLAALGLPADSPAAIGESHGRLHAESQSLPPLLTADAGVPMPFPGRWLVQLEDGEGIEGEGELRIEIPGYHRLETHAGNAVLAVAPTRCHAPPPHRPWGIAAQLYGLRRDGDAGLGDFAALADLLSAAARHGADAVALSPVHALFTADPSHFSPYAPSSRLMLNVLHADAPERDAALEAEPLVDWPNAARVRLAQFRRLFDSNAEADALAEFRARMGESLESHARFEALHAHFLATNENLWHWRDWPADFRDPASPAVAAFARDHADEVAFHAFLQMRADRGLAHAQRTAREAGMRVGLIADLAVGSDSGGSQAWGSQAQALLGLSIGAPPDLLNTRGQDWGLCAFSPHGLARNGYGAFIAMLRAALRHAGGVRIDHAMGLQRLWVVPHGAGPAEGAYLRMNLPDLLRLVRLESARHNAIVVAEDLGTVPEGFSETLAESGVLGMRVLWFEQDGGGYRAPRDWPAQAAAMTSTHDLPTVAGWWEGRDIDWRERLGLADDPVAARAERARERSALWQAFTESGAAQGPAPEHGTQAADAACRHVASAACELALIPLEDVLATQEQPNFPATIDEHPNWRRRTPAPAATLLDAPDVAARLAGIAAARRAP